MSDFDRIKPNHVGRKNHRCIWCGEPIPKGEPHFYQTGIWDGEWQNNHWHNECWDHGPDPEDDLRDGFTPYEGERPKG